MKFLKWLKALRAPKKEKRTTEDLVAWLQDYADKNHCYVAMNEPLYSPRFKAFQSRPELRYDHEDGDWCWCGKGARWLDWDIPEDLQSAPDPDFHVIYSPKMEA